MTLRALLAERLPLHHGLAGSVGRALRPGALALYAAGVLATGALIALGADDRVRNFVVEHGPPGGVETRFGILVAGMVWPLAPALLWLRRGFHEGRRESSAAGAAVLQTVILVALLTTAIKLLTGRPVPPSGVPASEFHFLDPVLASRNVWVMWPSGHTSEAVGAAAALVTFHAGQRRVAVVAGALAFTVAASMIVWNFHWLSDVVAGACLGGPIGRSIGRTFRAWADAQEDSTRAVPASD